MNLFPFAEYWWFYAAFLLGVGIILSLDLGIFHKKEHAVSFKEATIWSIVFVVLALAFNFGFYHYSSAKFGDEVGWTLAMEFLTGFVIEYSLSIDNIFVFVLIFSYFAIPAKYQHRVLFFGILGALLFRALFIGFGSVVMQFHWVIYLFGGFLIVTGIKMIFSSEQEIKPERNLLVRLMKKIIPVTSERDGRNFFTKIDGKYHATPLFIALIFLEFTDVVFAVDSVPAIFAVTKEPLIVFTSNIFAILGLRSMYFMLAGSVDKFHLLKYGLAIVLVFVGLKMVWLNDAFGGKFPITWSLGFILGTITVSIFASLMLPKSVKTSATKQQVQPINTDSTT